MKQNSHTQFKSISPIAIIGIGCRFPGAVSSVEDFWALISHGIDGIIDVPEDRWNMSRFYDSNPDAPGKMYVNKGGFLQDPLAQFDPLFFGITPREAACMDPQQRMGLHIAWEALEDAGIVPEHIAGSNTGVYMGVFTVDNLLQQMGTMGRDVIGRHSIVGSTASIVSNRISHVFDLRGPSVSIDTACSSSMVAIDMACQAIASGRCDLAIAGGVNIIFRPEYVVAMCKGKFLSKDGRCKTFDSRADGYARGEGAGKCRYCLTESWNLCANG